MKSIQFACAEDYLEQLTPTKSISRYSPLAVALADACKGSYPAPGGVYDIRVEHILEAAKALGLLIQNHSKGHQVGVSAEEFNSIKPGAVISGEFVCVHGFAAHTFIDNQNGPPTKVPCCRRCTNGLERPTNTEIKNAIAWLQDARTNPMPRAGALILAGHQLNFTTSKPDYSNLHIRKICE